MKHSSHFSLCSLALTLLAWLAAPSGEAHAQAVIRAGDQFEMRASGMPLEYANAVMLPYTVAEDGTVDIPMIGNMRAGGMTNTQFAKSVERKFMADKIFTHPTVVISLANTSRFVTIGGEVRGPQAVGWSADLTLNAAIQRAGGPNEFGNLKKVKVTRDGKAYFFNLKLVAKDPTQNPKLLPGDEIEVP